MSHSGATSKDDDDDDDDWDTVGDDLPEPPAAADSVQQDPDTTAPDDNDEEGWETPLVTETGAATALSNPSKPTDDKDTNMFLVDLTQLSKGEIHNRNDVHSVNDPDAVHTWRKRLQEAPLSDYAQNPDYLADATVIPCSSGVWKAALPTLRKERPGHYIIPIFPSTK